MNKIYWRPHKVSRFELVFVALLATLALLAVFEHLLMILPLPAEHLWRWSLANRRGVP